MIEINKREICNKKNPYIIAELSANHCGSLDRALRTIKSAKECGADAIKLQTYTANSMTLNSDKDDFLIKKGTWKGYKLFDLYQEASTPYEWHKKLFEYADHIGITIFSSPFDEEAVDFLEELKTPAFKIASFEILDLQLIKYIASKNKPILMSTGMASEDEIDEAVEVARKYGNGEILLFHCISSYPAPTSDSNVQMITSLRTKYGLDVGLSDHTLNNTAALASVALGGCAIEKHYILDKHKNGPDSSFSILPYQLKKLKEETTECWEALGCGSFKRSDSETENIVFRRSLYFVTDKEPGQTITPKDIRRIRPGYGLPPKYYDNFLNKKLKKAIKKGDRVSWDAIE